VLKVRHGDIVVFSVTDEMPGREIIKVATEHAASEDDEYKGQC
jgi:hypothetical protein